MTPDETVRRPARAAVLAVALLAPFLLTVVPAQRADAADMRVLQWNIDGAFRGSVSAQRATIDLVVEHLENTRPFVTSLNEICKQQIDRLVDAMPGGFSLYQVPVFRQGDGREHCGNEDDTIYFNVLIMQLDPVEPGRVHAYSTSPDSTVERRKVLCAHHAGFGVSIVGCTSHLTPPNVSVTALHQQINEYALFAAVFGVNKPIYALGDFNHRPLGHGGPHNDAQMDIFYNSYQESDGLPKRSTLASTGCGTPATGAVDYAFGLNGEVYVAQDASIGADRGISDHCLLVGHFNLK